MKPGRGWIFEMLPRAARATSDTPRRRGQNVSPACVAARARRGGPIWRLAAGHLMSAWTKEKGFSFGKIKPFCNDFQKSGLRARESGPRFPASHTDSLARTSRFLKVVLFYKKKRKPPFLLSTRTSNGRQSPNRLSAARAPPRTQATHSDLAAGEYPTKYERL